MPDISVAMCTYEGAHFVTGQLESIAEQTLLPAEIVVCDDGSTDGTVALVQQFAARAPFPVRLHRNTDRLGVTANFSRAISLCAGSIIALSDQDDVWVPEKLDRQVAVFMARPAVSAVFSDAELVDGALRPLGRSMFDATHFSKRRQRRVRGGQALDILLSRPTVCGATLAFRSSWRDLVLPIPPTGMHDEWLAVLLSAVGEVVALPEPLVRYRQHTVNQVGAPPSMPRGRLARRRTRGLLGDEVAHWQAMADRLAASPPASGGSRALPRLAGKVEHLAFRHQLPQPRSIPVLRELAGGRYHRYSRGMESAAFDLLFRKPGS